MRDLEKGSYPAFSSSLPRLEISEGNYLLRFVQSRDELDEILKLRFEVFNLELGEGLDASFLTGRDEDKYDLTCHHLAVYDLREQQLVGTYRIQTSAMAAAAVGFYSVNEFDLQTLPSAVIDEAVELGRACISRSHRNTQVLFLLWKGLAAYMQHNRKRYLFGCCSLASQDSREGLSVFTQLRSEGLLHPHFFVRPQVECQCEASETLLELTDRVTLPRLFRTYLRFGAKICGPPAIDRRFKTIDFLVLFDIAEMDASSRRVFFGE